MPRATIQNHTSCQVSWIIIFNTYNLHPFNSICLSHIFQHASIQSTCDSFFMHYKHISHQASIIYAKITWYIYQLWHKNAHNNPHSSLKIAGNTQNYEHQIPFTGLWLNSRLKELFIESKNVLIRVRMRKL